MRTSYLTLALIVLPLIAGCSVSTTVIPMSPTLQRPPVAAESVQVFRSASEISQPYEVLAIVQARGLANYTSLDAFVRALQERGAQLGADAIIIGEIDEPSFVAKALSEPNRTASAHAIVFVTEVPPVAAANTATPSRPSRPDPTSSIAWRRHAPQRSEVVTLQPTDLKSSEQANVYERVADAVVALNGDQGSGTAFLITRDGLALTNHHVVADQSVLVARTRDNRRLLVRVLRSDPVADVALIQIHCEQDCWTVDLAEASPRVGTDVFVIGNPAGLDFTITRGIVSGLRLDRGVTLLQTDASINRGNSGGPIFDPATGKVVGIVSWKFSGGGAEGLGFGVTIGDALRVLGVQR
jgi:hypothetical protein